MRAFDIYARYRYTYVRIIYIIREFLKTKAMLKVCHHDLTGLATYETCQIVPKVLFDTTVTKMIKMVTHVIKKTGPKANTGRKK